MFGPEGVSAWSLVSLFSESLFLTYDIQKDLSEFLYLLARISSGAFAETVTERRIEGRKTERRMTERRMTEGRMIEGRK